MNNEDVSRTQSKLNQANDRERYGKTEENINKHNNFSTKDKVTEYTMKIIKNIGVLSW